ncbi:MAG: acetyltransferase [Lachnospiraceae bacterium]|nr:acetyltransferase [Lachnospiraceae bacterium]
MNGKILLIGGGGHCRSVLDTICSGCLYNVVGIVARDEANYNLLHKDPQLAPHLVGMDANLPELFMNGWKNAFVTLGSVGNPIGRKKVYSALKTIGFHLPIIMDKSAVISESSLICEGAYIGKKTLINAGCRIGCCSIINSGSIIEHDCTIGDFAHISSGTILCGEVHVGENTHVGAGTTVRQQIVIGKDSLIGIGSVVVKNIPDNVNAYGIPCKVVNK